MIFPPIGAYPRSGCSTWGRDINFYKLGIASQRTDGDYILKDMYKFSRQEWKENFVLER